MASLVSECIGCAPVFETHPSNYKNGATRYARQTRRIWLFEGMGVGRHVFDVSAMDVDTSEGERSGVRIRRHRRIHRLTRSTGLPCFDLPKNHLSPGVVSAVGFHSHDQDMRGGGFDIKNAQPVDVIKMNPACSTGMNIQSDQPMIDF